MRAVSNLFHDRRSASAGFAGTCRRSFVGPSPSSLLLLLVGRACALQKSTDLCTFTIAVCYYYYFILPSLATKKKCSTSLLIVWLIAGCC